jgi:predicted dehydrogenase
MVRLGLIGHGDWGRKIERTLRPMPDVALRIIRHTEPLQRGLDGAVIATPRDSHAQMAMPYIEAGTATFIEKPMTTNSADAQRIRLAAERSGALVFVGHIHRFNPAFQALVALLPTIGSVRHVIARSMSDRQADTSGLLWEWLPHDLSMADLVFGGPPDRVSARAVNEAGSAAAAVTLSFGAASMASIVGWRAPKRIQEFTVIGEHGSLAFNDRSERKLIHQMDGRVVFPDYDPEPPLTRELSAFIAAIRAGSRDFGHLRLGSRIVAAIEAAEVSMARGGAWVSIGRCAEL